MFRITVNANKVALVWKRGVLVDILTEGKHWVNLFLVEVKFYDTMAPLMDQSLMPYLEDFPGIAHYLDIKTIDDSEIGIEYKGELFNRVLETGKVGYWNGMAKYQLDIFDLNEVEISSSIKSHLLMKPELFRRVSTFYVDTTQIGLLYIDGVLIGRKSAGVYRYWKASKDIKMKIVETRVQAMDVPGQEILTKDKAGIRVNFYAQYKVVDVEKAIIEAVDYYKQLYASMQMLLRA